MYTPKNLTKWQSASNYGGDDLSEWYILASQTRDSYLLERNNFESIKEHLIKHGFEVISTLDPNEQDSAILCASFGHWACGWIESLMIHESNEQGLILGDEIKAALDDYPIFDDESYYAAELDLIFNDVKEYNVKEWMDDRSEEYTDSLLNYVTEGILQKYDFELNSYDEVIPCKSIQDGDIEFIVDRYNHLTTCPNCHDKADNRYESCSCQMKLM